ncbi:MAG: glycosyltransferase family 2 protein [Cyanobacteria bacterium P01_A01_bin.17]
MVNSSQPLVSVVMPSFNQASFIERAINSILGQSYSPIELWVVDGASTDGTVELLMDLQKADTRLHVLSESDDGPADALNKGFQRARGTVIGWLNADDCYTLGAIARAVQYFMQYPHHLMVYGEGEHIDEAGSYLERYPTQPVSEGIDAMVDGCFICQPTVFFRRTFHILLGALDVQLKTAFDFEYWLRAFKYFPERIGYIEAVQAQSRLHDSCITRSQRRTVALEGMEVIARYLGQAPAHWLLTYREELLTESVDFEGELGPHLLETLAIAKPWLSAADYGRLERIFSTTS